jgi:hypothetical protein
MRRSWVVVFVVVVAIAIGGYLVFQAGVRAGQAGAGGTVERLLTMRDNRYVLEGWRHQGPGGFTLDSTAGVLKSYGGMGLLWYGAKQYGDFVLELDFRCADSATNSGVFLRVPGEPTSDEYIYHSFEIQISDAVGEGIHRTGAVYDAEAPSDSASRAPGEWNHFAITFRGSHITVVLNDKKVIDWDAAPRGKVRDFAPRGYIGLQNHDDRSPVEFRNVLVRELP